MKEKGSTEIERLLESCKRVQMVLEDTKQTQASSEHQCWDGRYSAGIILETLSTLQITNDLTWQLKDGWFISSKIHNEAREGEYLFDKIFGILLNAAKAKWTVQGDQMQIQVFNDGTFDTKHYPGYIKEA